jgi:hypothetical protein
LFTSKQIEREDDLEIGKNLSIHDENSFFISADDKQRLYANRPAASFRTSLNERNEEVVALDAPVKRV